FQKNQYRKFNIRSADLTPGDDFGMMREVLSRRFKRLIDEVPRPEAAAQEPRPEAALQEPRPEAAAQEPRPEAALQEPRQGAAGLQEAPQASPTGDLTEGTPPEEAEKDDDSASPWPDLVVIDGGRGQLGAAQETLASLGLTDVPLLAVAKGPDRDAGLETFFQPGREPFKLKPRDPVLYFVQGLRDEAHRFAIGSHRVRRRRDIREAGLQEIPGIGPTRKRALLHHFGTLKAIERAALADLAKVPGISA